MTKKLIFRTTGPEAIYEELAKKGITKPIKITDEGHLWTLEVSDDWTKTDLTALKDIVKTVSPNKTLIKEV